MTIKEHLKRIRARCVELLEIAEKRTPGRWVQDHIYVDTDDKAVFIKADGNSNNAAFIAVCPGPAEAGWKATIAAIDLLDETADIHSYDYSPLATETAKQIITSWPEELLK